MYLIRYALYELVDKAMLKLFHSVELFNESLALQQQLTSI